MNSVQIGKEFEKEAFEYLQNKFDKVIWLSEKSKSVFDFKCIKNHKEYFGDAKLINKQYGKPCVKYTQRDADFIVAKINGKIKFIIKGSNGWNTQKENLDTTLIEVYKDTRKDIMMFKLQTNAKNVPETMKQIIKKLKEQSK